MTTFLVGAGAAATVILAILGTLQYTRSRSNLLVQVYPHLFEFPTSVAEAFIDLDRLFLDEDLGERGARVDAVALRAKEMLGVLGPLMTPRSFGINAFWILKLRNRGHERAEGVELRVPGAIQVAVKRADSHEVANKDRVMVGDVRPGETVEVLAWGRSYALSDAPTVIQSKGRAVIRVHGMVGPTLVAASEFWRYGRPFIIIILLGVSVIATVLVARVVQRSQGSAHPPDSSAVSR